MSANQVLNYSAAYLLDGGDCGNPGMTSALEPVWTPVLPPLFVAVEIGRYAIPFGDRLSTTTSNLPTTYSHMRPIVGNLP
jgi:hypothetical protein